MLGLVLLITHIVISYVGFLFSESHLLRSEKHHFLDTFEESIVIVEEETHKFIHQNQAAKEFRIFIKLAKLKNDVFQPDDSDD